jgi:hemerythrin-like metal-binding protein
MPDMDSEHQGIFALAAEMHQAIRTGAGAPQLQTALTALLAQIKEHFEHEERLMRETAYSSYAWHKRQHDTASSKAAALEGRIRGGDTEAALALLHFLSAWLKDHTSVADRMMAAHVRNAQRSRARLAS